MFLTVGGGGASVARSSSNYRALSSAVGVRPGIGFTYRRGYAYPSLGTPAVLDGASCWQEDQRPTIEQVLRHPLVVKHTAVKTATATEKRPSTTSGGSSADDGYASKMESLRRQENAFKQHVKDSQQKLERELPAIIENPWKSLKILENHQKSSEIIENHRKSSKIIENHRKSSKIIENHRKSSKIIKNHQKSSKNGQKSSTIVNDRQQSSTIVNNRQQSNNRKNHQKSLKKNCMCHWILAS